MREQFQEEIDRGWEAGEVRTFTVVNRDAGTLYTGEWVRTADGGIFGPCNETWTPIPAEPTPLRPIR